MSGPAKRRHPAGNSRSINRINTKLCLGCRGSSGNRNHRLRDCAVGEDSCLARTGNGPANRAPGDDLALVVVLSCCRGGEYGEGLVETRRRFQLHRDDALPAVCTPGHLPTTHVPAPAPDNRFVPGLPPIPTAGGSTRTGRRPQRAPVAETPDHASRTDTHPIRNSLRCAALRQSPQHENVLPMTRYAMNLSLSVANAGAATWRTAESVSSTPNLTRIGPTGQIASVVAQ